MLILTIKTDSPKSEVGLYSSKTKLAYTIWEANRQLAETINVKIQDILKKTNKNLEEVSGVVIYIGPGSFTGLRIGLTVAQALAYAQKCSIVGVGGDNWLHMGIDKLLAGETQQSITLNYGAEANITKPKK